MAEEATWKHEVAVAAACRVEIEVRMSLPPISELPLGRFLSGSSLITKPQKPSSSSVLFHL